MGLRDCHQALCWDKSSRCRGLGLPPPPKERAHGQLDVAALGTEFGMHQKVHPGGEPPWGCFQSQGAARRTSSLEVGVGRGGSIPASMAQPGCCDRLGLAGDTGTYSRLKEKALAGFGFISLAMKAGPRPEGPGGGHTDLRTKAGIQGMLCSATASASASAASNCDLGSLCRQRAQLSLSPVLVPVTLSCPQYHS